MFGDTNFLYTSEGEYIREFLSKTRMKDPWVELIRKGAVPEEGSDELECANPTTTNECEALDKIL